MIDRYTKERIMEAARIEEVIGEFVSLKRSGSNYIGLCPFHPDNHPSLSVSASRQFFKCFSCGHSGNVISFLMDHEHISYPEALKYLAHKYGIEVVEKEETPEEAAARMRSESLLIVNEAAQKYYQDVLWDPELGHHIGLGYFRNRGFTDETIRRFGLGYAPGGYDTFTRYAIENGYKEEYLTETGLSIKHDDGRLSDRFYDRVMFPIYSLSGKVIAFGGRILSSDKKLAKYVNSPESIIYNKSRSTLYGLFQAKNAIAKQDKCIMVEGYADVISMHQRGIENVVASSGTSLTEGHINLVKRFTKDITFSYDSDPAGIKASMRGINMVLAAGMEVKVVLLPQGEDPDSFAQANEKSDIEEYLAAHERDFVSFKMEILSKDVADNDIYGRTQMINDIVQTVSVIPDDIIRNVYIENVAQTFGLQQDSVFARVARLRQQRLDQARRRDYYNRQEQAAQGTEGYDAAADAEATAARNDRRESGARITPGEFLSVCEKELASFLLKWGEYTIHWESNMNYGAEQIPEVTVSEFIRSSLEDDGLSFENPLYRKVYDEYYSLDRTPAEGEKDEDVQGRLIKYFTFHDDSGIMRFATDILSDDHPITVRVYNESLTPEELRLNKDVPRAVLEYKKRIVTLRQTSLKNEISVAEKSGEEDRKRSLMHQLMLLTRVRAGIDKELKKF